MSVCAECGTEVDPDVTHPRHHPDCPRAEWGIGWDCSCDEVCAACCTDPDCPTRTPQETPVDDSAPLTDDELAAIDLWFKGKGDCPPVGHVQMRLYATVEQTRRERDAALERRDEVIKLSAEKLKQVQQERDAWRVKWEHAQDEIDALVGDSIALRMARAGTERTTDG